MVNNNDLDLLFLKTSNTFGEKVYIRLSHITSFSFDDVFIEITYQNFNTGEINISQTDLDKDDPLGDLANRIRVAIEVENG